MLRIFFYVFGLICAIGSICSATSSLANRFFGFAIFFSFLYDIVLDLILKDKCLFLRKKSFGETLLLSFAVASNSSAIYSFICSEKLLEYIFAGAVAFFSFIDVHLIAKASGRKWIA